MTLKDQYPSLFNITRKHITVAHVFTTTPLNITFRRALVGDKLLKWNGLVARVAFVQLYDQQDSIKWLSLVQGCFTVQSMCKRIINQIATRLNKARWKLNYL